MMTGPNPKPAGSSPADTRLHRREALKTAVRAGILLYCAPKVLHSEAVYAQAGPSGGGDPSGVTDVPPNGPNPGVFPILPLVGLPALGLIGAGGGAGIGVPAVPPTVFGIPLAASPLAPLTPTPDTALPVPRGRRVLNPSVLPRGRRRGVLGPRPFDNLRRRPIRGLG